MDPFVEGAIGAFGPSYGGRVPTPMSLSMTPYTAVGWGRREQTEEVSR